LNGFEANLQKLLKKRENRKEKKKQKKSERRSRETEWAQASFGPGPTSSRPESVRRKALSPR
jgi:hypothetical protein